MCVNDFLYQTMYVYCKFFVILNKTTKFKEQTLGKNLVISFWVKEKAKRFIKTTDSCMQIKFISQF